MLTLSDLLKVVVAGVILTSPAAAEQVVVRHTEYSNDKITDGGHVVACVVTLAVVASPDPRILNFQFLQFNGRAGWKITGGVMNWKDQSAVAKRVADGNFSASAFLYKNAFQKDLTPEGQLVGVLTRDDLYHSFSQAFFQRPYSVSVRWENAADETDYYIEESPPLPVVRNFRDCVSTLH